MLNIVYYIFIYVRIYTNGTHRASHWVHDKLGTAGSKKSRRVFLEGTVSPQSIYMRGKFDEVPKYDVFFPNRLLLVTCLLVSLLRMTGMQCPMLANFYLGSTFGISFLTKEFLFKRFRSWLSLRNARRFFREPSRILHTLFNTWSSTTSQWWFETGGSGDVINPLFWLE